MPDPIAERVFRQAERVDAALPLIGYRRRPVTVAHEGWQVRVPGSFGEQRTAEEWRGGERGRRVTLAATTTQTTNGMPMSADRFLTTVAGDLGEGVLRHEDGELERPRPGDLRRELGARGGGARGLLGRDRERRRDPGGVRALRRLGVGRRPVEVAPPRLSPR